MNLLFDKILHQHAKGLPFVCFRKPNKNLVKGVFVSHTQLMYANDYKEKGFVFAPFDNINKSILFSYDDSEVVEESIETVLLEQPITTSVDLSDKEKHIALVNSGIESIADGNFKKVVLSRKEEVTITDFNPAEVFTNLLTAYQNAFVYVWFHPKVGLWFGATPERLVTLKDNKFATTALASTQPYKGDLNPDWGDKEKEEHQFVVDYIVSQIQDQTNGIILKNFTVSDTYSAKAGSLIHLKADITGEIGSFSLKNLLKTLHPTPAVCGLPKEEAKQFILENENYNRSFYTGFLGEINHDDETELFVNLRCAEYIEKTICIYVGGGITLHSDSEKEWKETVAKTQTIKKVL